MRRSGVLLIGTSVGATLTSDVPVEFADLLPLMALMALFVNLVSLALLIPTARITG